jgi:hypothetical protein
MAGGDEFTVTKPFSIGFVDDNSELTKALKESIEYWSAQFGNGLPLIKIEVYTSPRNFYRDRQVHDLWLIDVNLGQGLNWAGTDVFVNVLATSSAKAILYSSNPVVQEAFGAFDRSDAPFRFMLKDPKNVSDFLSTICEEFAQIRQQWLDACHLMLPDAESKADLDSPLDIRGRGRMTLRQVFADVLIEVKDDTNWEDLARRRVRHASTETSLLMRYAKAFGEDLSAAENASQPQWYGRSLPSALGHKLVKVGEAGIPETAEEIKRVAFAEVARFNLRAATVQRLASKLTVVADGGYWTWPKADWKVFKKQTSFNLIAFLHQIADHSSVTLKGEILTRPLPEDGNGWFELAEQYKLSTQYFCEPDDWDSALRALTAQRESEQYIEVELQRDSAALPSDRIALTLIFTFRGMRLMDESCLNRATVDTTSGAGFGIIWDRLRGYGTWLVRSGHWPEWVNPLALDVLWERDKRHSLPEPRESDTCFVFKTIAPIPRDVQLLKQD